MIDVVQAFGGARLLAAAYERRGGRTPGITNILLTHFPNANLSTVRDIPSSNIAAGGIFWVDPNGLHVALLGIMNGRQGQIIAGGYADGALTREKQGYHPYAREVAIDIRNNHLRPVLDGHQRINIYGHSAGGLIAESLAHLIHTQIGRATIHLNTYGAPAPFVPGRQEHHSRTTRNRWINRNDPVPFIPAARISPTEYFLLAARGTIPFQSEDNTLVAFSYAQPGLGLAIGGGGCRRQMYPTMTLPVALQMRRWLDDESSATAQHSCATYRNALAFLATEFPNGMPEQSNAPVPQEENIGRVTFALMQGRVASFASRRVEPLVLRQPSSLLDSTNVPIGTYTMEFSTMSFLKINPKKAFRLVRVGRQWQVSCGDRVVAVADTPKRPRTLCKRLNGMLRAVGTDNTIWLAEFIAALQDWMTNAASDETYCRPTMRVDL